MGQSLAAWLMLKACLFLPRQVIEILDTDSDAEEEGPVERNGDIPVKRETRSDAAAPPCGLATPGAAQSKGSRHRVTFASDYTTPPARDAAAAAVAAPPAAGLDQPARSGDLVAKGKLQAPLPAGPGVSQGRQQALMAAGQGLLVPDGGPRQLERPPPPQSQTAAGGLPIRQGQGYLPAHQSQGGHPIMRSGCAHRPPQPPQQQQLAPPAAALGGFRGVAEANAGAWGTGGGVCVGAEQQADAAPDAAGRSARRGTRGAVGGRDVGDEQHASAAAGRSNRREGLRSLPDRPSQQRGSLCTFPVALVVQPAGSAARLEFRADMALSVAEDGSIAHEVSCAAVCSCAYIMAPLGCIMPPSVFTGGPCSPLTGTDPRGCTMCQACHCCCCLVSPHSHGVAQVWYGILHLYEETWN